ncbi:MAG: hypothetical protein WB290_14420 [Smithella sp.]
MNPKKVANNILEFLFDPTVIPVERRMYFGPEERLDNRSLEKAKADSQQAYGKENKNSDFYPTRNRQQTQREASIMDRKTIIASLDVLSQNFDETDSIGESLRAMAYTVSKMADEEFETRTAKKKVEFVTCPKCGNKKVMKQTGYCVKCGKKGIGKDDKKEDKKEDKDGKKKKKASEDFWTKAASEAVALALVEDIVGMSDDDAKDEDKEKTAHGKDCECPDCKEEKEAKKKDDDEACMDSEAKKKVDDEMEPEAKKKDDEDVEAKKKDDEDVEAKKKDDEDIEAKKKDDEDVEAKKEEDAKKVNTDILGNVEGIEMDLGALSLDEVELTASDKEQLDKLFQ